MSFCLDNFFNFGNNPYSSCGSLGFYSGGCQQGFFNPIASIFGNCNGYPDSYGGYSNCCSNRSIFTYDYGKYARLTGDDYGGYGCCRPNYAAEAGLGAINALFTTAMMCFANKQAEKQNNA